MSEIDIVYRNKVRAVDRPKIRDSRSCYDLFLSNWDMNRIELLEQFKVMFIDHSNHCMGISNISTGGITGCIADPRLIFGMALKARATRIVVAHNHPSGNLVPSKADDDLTGKLVLGGSFLEIPILDHLIVTADSYYSYADEARLLPF